jgi:hypothetical protein
MKQDRYIEVEFEETRDLPLSLADWQAWLEKVIDDIPEQSRAEATMRLGTFSEYGDSYARLTVAYTRPETDEEEAKREARESAHQQETRDRELEQLRRLQAKYPGKGGGK